MFEFKPTNRLGNIIQVSWRGVKLGRVMVLRNQSKRKKDKLVRIIDRDYLDVIKGSALWNSLGRPMTKEKAAEIMKRYHKGRKV